MLQHWLLEIALGVAVSPASKCRPCLCFPPDIFIVSVQSDDLNDTSLVILTCRQALWAGISAPAGVWVPAAPGHYNNSSCTWSGLGLRTAMWRVVILLLLLQGSRLTGEVTSLIACFYQRYATYQWVLSKEVQKQTYYLSYIPWWWLLRGNVHFSGAHHWFSKLVPTAITIFISFHVKCTLFAIQMSPDCCSLGVCNPVFSFHWHHPPCTHLKCCVAGRDAHGAHASGHTRMPSKHTQELLLKCLQV